MRKYTIIVLMILFTALSYAQVGINTNTPDDSSALEIKSTSGGLLIPRMTVDQRDTISSPSEGLMIYQLNGTVGFYFYDGTAWTKIDGVAGTPGTNGSDGASAYTVWLAAGNTGTETEFLTALIGQQGQQGERGSDGFSAYRVINTIHEQIYPLDPNSSTNGAITGINSSHLVLNFIPSHNENHNINLSITLFDSNDQPLEVYVEEYKFRRDREYSLRKDYSKPEIKRLNCNPCNFGFSAIYGSVAYDVMGFSDIKIWTNGEISYMNFTMSSTNSRARNPIVRNSKLIVHTFTPN